ncbi:MAG: heme exporter protein CcmD [Gammaproteobacteria bacterium]
MAEFFNMGGYAFYVWLSYGLTAIILIANIVMPMLHDRQIKRELLMRIDREKNMRDEKNASSS